MSPDGRQVAFTAPAADGYFQIFRMPIGGGAPVQSDHRSVAQDASRRGHPTAAHRVHGLELQAEFWTRMTQLRGGVLVDEMSRPLPDWLPRSILTFSHGYTAQAFVADLIAGVTVGLVALPLAMAFAIASGLTPQAGIYCAIITGFIISALGGSRFQIGGPTGAFVVVVSGIVAQYGIDGLFMCTLMAGVILMVMGLTGSGHRRQVHSQAGHHRLHQRHRARHHQHAAQGLSRPDDRRARRVHRAPAGDRRSS